MTQRRQMLALGTEILDQGLEFTKWPLHITLVSWFESAKQSKLSDGLETVSREVKPFKVLVGALAYFGKHHDVRVRLIDDNDMLRELHEKTLSVVEGAGAGSTLDRSFVGQQYRPHITDRHEIIDQAVYPLEQIALIDDLGNHVRRVTEVFELG